LLLFQIRTGAVYAAEAVHDFKGVKDLFLFFILYVAMPKLPNKVIPSIDLSSELHRKKALKLKTIMWRTYVHEIKIKKNIYLVMVLLDYLQKLVNCLECFLTNIAVSSKRGQ